MLAVGHLIQNNAWGRERSPQKLSVIVWSVFKSTQLVGD